MYMYVFLARYSPYDLIDFYTLDQSVAASCERIDLLTFHCSTSGQRVRLHSARFLYAPRVGSTCRGSPEAPYYVSPESTRTPLPLPQGCTRGKRIPICTKALMVSIMHAGRECALRGYCTNSRKAWTCNIPSSVATLIIRVRSSSRC